MDVEYSRGRPIRCEEGIARVLAVLAQLYSGGGPTSRTCSKKKTNDEPTRHPLVRVRFLMPGASSSYTERARWQPTVVWG
jgi:hypothetical protein